MVFVGDGGKLFERMEAINFWGKKVVVEVGKLRASILKRVFAAATKPEGTGLAAAQGTLSFGSFSLGGKENEQI